ncbi:ATP-binding protein [Actinokineospora auranticolor]|uniref:Serine/threonine-protein kinase RsbW n=1 Tax=Actinokineospora auranticolor TaxID=155976 RepID=A0A2S6GCZ7_9PSEU|nr:ATP-binding protein [Actinokineospora auranticolor]PPK63127.1 serine/threonine-protein kinase RsbW [Actinokineospora auranticolor]
MTGDVGGELRLGPVPPAVPSAARVELRLGADQANLTVARSVARSTAAMLDADLDTISDLTLAVDEVCSTLIRLAAPGEPVELTFRRSAAAMTVDASVVAVDDAGPDTGTFGWQILDALVDQVSFAVRPDPRGRPVVRITLVLTRTAGAG